MDPYPTVPDPPVKIVTDPKLYPWYTEILFLEQFTPNSHQMHKIYKNGPRIAPSYGTIWDKFSKQQQHHIQCTIRTLLVQTRLNSNAHSGWVFHAKKDIL